VDHDHTGQAHERSAHHAHSHAPRRFGRAFAIAALLNIGLVFAQVFYGVLAHSVALLTDASHNFGDVLSLLLAWAAHGAAQRRPTTHYTYGFRSASILAALVNALLLLVVTGAIAWEAILRFSEPGEVAGLTVMIVAGIGIIVNAGSALLLMPGSKGDLNMRGAFLHLVADAGVSAVVLLAGAAILVTGWNWLDPLASIVVSVVIVWSTWGLLRDTVRLSLDAVPANIDPAAVRRYLEGLPGVARIHDLHIWAMSTTEIALTAHLVVPGGHPGDPFLLSTAHGLTMQFGIGHATLQLEVSEETACRLAPDEVV